AADQLRLEQLAETLRVERAAVEDRFASRRRRLDLAVPVAHELAEVDVADLGAVEALHARRNTVRKYRHGQLLSCCRSARRASHWSRVCPQISTGWSSSGGGNRPGPRLLDPSRTASAFEAWLSGSIEWITSGHCRWSNAQSIAAVAASIA